MKTVDIKGKEYVMINERIIYFRTSDNYKGWSLVSDVIRHEAGQILIKATIYNDKGIIQATGHAQEKDGDGFINKTSYVENCETSAWGRALGNMGIGIDTSIASAEEVQNAIKQSIEPLKTRDVNSDIVKGFINKINGFETLDQLGNAFKLLSPELQKNAEILEAAKNVKTKLSK